MKKQNQSPENTKELQLPNGMRVTMSHTGELNFRIRREAKKLVSDKNDPEELAYAIFAKVIKIDGDAPFFEDLLNFPDSHIALISDFVAKNITATEPLAIDLGK